MVIAHREHKREFTFAKKVITYLSKLKLLPICVCSDL